MATGTEGPDVLSNDQSLSEEAIDALGGDDIINVTNRPSGASWITVDGGSGVDTLTITAPYLRALGSTFALMSNGYNTGDNPVDYSSVERLVVYAGVFFGFDRFGHQSGMWRTGDTTDEIHVTGTFDRTARVAVVTAGGDDKIYFGAVARGSSAFGGTGDDLVDLSGVQGDSIDPLNPVSAYGEDGNDRLIGSSHTDRLDGGVGNDELFSGDGFDALYGGAGDDLLYFGAWFTGTDRAHGGEGRDVLLLQGEYDLTVSGASLTGIELISLLSGADTRFGDTAGNFYDYHIIIHESAIDNLLAAGQELSVNGQALRAGEDFAFDGSAELEGKFVLFGGHGVDTLKGGNGNDVFVFDGDRWGAGDRVDGGGGRDSLVITAGNGLTHIDFGPASLAGIESISVANRYSSDPSATPSYEFVLDNGNVAPGGTLIVNASSLAAGQVMKLDGRGVRDGNLILFGGAGHDTLTGGDGSDLIVGGARADGLTGGAGADIFRYDSASDSAPGLEDLIGDFQSGVDRIDLGRIDADSSADGDQAFRWIGSDAFAGLGAASAGELRSFESGGYRRVEGDTDGDGAADLVIVLQVGTPPLGAGDFVL